MSCFNHEMDSATARVRASVCGDAGRRHEALRPRLPRSPPRPLTGPCAESDTKAAEADTKLAEPLIECTKTLAHTTRLFQICFSRVFRGAFSCYRRKVPQVSCPPQSGGFRVVGGNKPAGLTKPDAANGAEAPNSMSDGSRQSRDSRDVAIDDFVVQISRTPQK